MLSQPKARDRRAGQTGPICLIPELAYITGRQLQPGGGTFCDRKTDDDGNMLAADGCNQQILSTR